ncbi:leucine-rich repeat-containing protein let-4-like [Aphidius gifuensis]|uniref:leucine-rich repeat-containing protein let-4-like n=1 Tax=Aphidius gifuensis TaxID=684658 RepID=UPI001CDBDBB4|nr:leucine-rich repeat-containing protein let-4-like [Aphidius gifuensis]
MAWQMTHPFKIIISGPSGAGKSVWTKRFLKELSGLCDTEFDRIILYDAEWQPVYTEYKNVEFQEGLPDMKDFNDIKKKKLIIMDDLMRESSSGSSVLDIFTKGSHHPNDTARHLNKVLYQHSNLDKLELMNNQNTDICYSTRKNISVNISQLQYTGGSFKTLTHKSFECLRNLRNLTITNSDLTFLEPGSLNGLEKLETVSIRSNDKLTHIPSNVFNVKSLKIIDLSNNSISRVDDGAFKSSNNNLMLLNLSYNLIEIIEGGVFQNFRCEVIDLTQSGIVAIVDGAFNNSRVDKIFLMKNQIFNLNYLKWGIHYTATMVYIDFTNFDIFESYNNSRHLTKWDESFHLKKSYSCYLSESVHKTDNAFMIYPESFVGLTELENLELDVGPIILQAQLFESLSSLKFLKIEVEESIQYLSQVLVPLSNLKTIEIVGNRSVGICQNKFSSKIPYSLTDIRYTKGPLKELQENSMTCISQLEKFTIKNTQLSTIQAGAFKSMDNLKFVNLEFNQITMIPKDTFDGLKCDFFHLSHNKIRRIEYNAFKNSDIKNLYLFNISSNVSVNKKAWSLPEYTDVHSTVDDEKHQEHFFKHPTSGL